MLCLVAIKNGGNGFCCDVRHKEDNHFFYAKRKAMTLIGFLVLLAVAAICGAIGQSLAGCFVSIVVGFIGAWLGMWVAGQMGLPELFAVTIEGKSFPIVWAIIGSALFTLIMALLRRAVSGRRV